MFLDDLLNGSRKQLAAPFADVVVFARDWGFRLGQVKVPVRWWHGDRDHIVPFAHGQHVVSRLPDAELYTLSGASHPAGLGFAEEILRTIIELWDSIKKNSFSSARHTVARCVVDGANASEPAADQRSTQFVHRRALGLDDGCLRLLRRGAGLR